MNRKQRLLIIISAVAALLAIGVILSLTVFTDFLVSLWWYRSLGYASYFWGRLLYRYLVLFAAVLLFFAVFFGNLWYATQRIDRSFRVFRLRSLWFSIPLSLVLSILLAYPLAANWEQSLLLLTMPDAGTTDPVFGRDISYYLGAWPVYRLIHGRLFFAAMVVFLGITGIYLAESRLTRARPLDLTKTQKRHLGAVFVTLTLLGYWHFMLDRFGLLFERRNLPAFTGPGYIEMTWVLACIWVAAVATLGLGAATIYVAAKGRRIWIPGALALLLLLAVLGRYSEGVRSVVARLRIEPNEIAVQRPYVSASITSTRNAFDLHDVRVREMLPGRDVSSEVTPEEVLRNIPLWDQRELRQVFNQLQELRTFYVFSPVDVGRYQVDENRQQVFLAARQIDMANLPTARQTWINEHLSYTHGFGTVMTSANQLSDIEIPWLIKGIPAESRIGLSPAEPRIYYGQGSPPYVVAPNAIGEVDATGEADEGHYAYGGEGGVQLGAIWKQAVFARYFRDPNLFLSTQFTPASRILYRRNIVDRVQRLAPFLTLDSDPYLVITDERLYWIVDAYTTADAYPYGDTTPLGGREIAYIRNSVKIVVDAYDGSVDFYVAEPDEPFVAAYRKIYPNLFRPLEQMPENIRAHLRYPRDIFGAQMDVYTRYHQTDPVVFYRGQDVWEPAAAPMDDVQDVRPRYITANLLDLDRLDYSLVLPMVPKGRENLRAVVVAGAASPEYGNIVVNSFPRGELVFGFSQIDSIIEEEPTISEQFTLWDQEGSRVIQGPIIAIPVNSQLLYVEPVFIEATEGPAVPQLERVILSEGTVAVIGASLEEAYAKLQERTAE